MADNIDVTSGAGTTVGFDDIGGVKFQRVKLIFGADGVNSGDVAAGNELPVTVSNIVTAGTSGTPSAAVLSVQGTEAHDATAIGSPSLQGAKALAHGTNPTGVTAGDASYIYCNRAGVPWVIGGHPNIISRSCRITSTQTDASLVGTIGSGTKVVITQISCKMDATNSTNFTVAIGFGASAVPTPAEGGVNGMVLEGEFSAGAGQQVGNGAGIIAIGGDGEELRITSDDPGAGNIFVAFSYYTIES